MISVIVPAYNEEENIFPAAEAISGVLKEAAVENEIIFVNDGSSDAT